MKLGPKELERRAMREAQQRRPPDLSRVIDPRIAPPQIDLPPTRGLIAPPGECPYCDRRRAKTAAKVAAWRKAKKDRP